MGLAVVVLVIAFGVARLCGGTARRLGELRLRRRALVVAAVLAQGGGALVGLLGVTNARHAYVAGLAASAVCAVAFCLSNFSVPGLALVTAGLLGNAVVVGINGAMPVSIHAAYRARVPIATIATGTDPRHDIAGRGDHWRWLGDIVPVPLPWRPEVISPGDVLVSAGLAELVMMTMLGGVVMRWGQRRESPHGKEGTQTPRSEEEQG
jgi:hypothetical protein